MPSNRFSIQRLRRETDGWSVSSFVICLILLLPILWLLGAGNTEGSEWAHIRKYLLPGYIRNTVWLSVAVLTLSLLMAVPPAWLLSTFQVPGRRWLDWAMVLPLAIPTYVAAFVYMDVQQHTIPLQIWVRQHVGVDAQLFTEAFIRKGTLALFMSAVLSPYLYLSLRASFKLQRRGVIEAAQLLGRGPGAVFFTVALPLARPALIAGLGLILMEVINDYGAVHFFSVPTLTVGIFRAWTDFEDLGSAVRIAAMVLMAIVVLIGLEALQRGRARFTDNGSDQAAFSARPLSRGKGAAAFLACMTPLTIGFIIPVLRLSFWAARSVDRIAFGKLLGRMGNSLLLALGTALLLTVIAALLAYSDRLHRLTPLRWSISLASMGYAIPGAVIAVGVMSLSGSIQQLGSGFWLTGTVLGIGFAYMVRFLAVALHPIRAGMHRVCGGLDQASRLLGHPPLRTFTRINVPLLRGTLLSVTMLVFVDILKELPLTIILRPARFETLSIYAYSLAKEARIQECAIPSLLIILLAGLGLYCFNRVMLPGNPSSS